jgi:hypothetical protein
MYRGIQHAGSITVYAGATQPLVVPMMVSFFTPYEGGAFMENTAWLLVYFLELDFLFLHYRDLVNTLMNLRFP